MCVSMYVCMCVSVEGDGFACVGGESIICPKVARQNESIHLDCF